MKLKNIIHIAAVCGMAGCLAACSDSEPTTVYIPEARSLNIVNFDLAEPMSQTFHVAVTASDYVTTSGLEVSSDVTVTLSVDPRRWKPTIPHAARTTKSFPPTATHSPKAP